MRWAAFLSFAAVALWFAYEANPLLPAALLLVPAAILLVNRSGWRALRANPALLVPLGFRVLAVALVLALLPRRADWFW